MAVYIAHTDVPMPVLTDKASWFEAIARVSATDLTNGQQPSGY